MRTSVVLGYEGKILTNLGAFKRAEQTLLQSLSAKQDANDTIGLSEVLEWLAELYEISSELPKAESYYLQVLEHQATGRRNYHCAALAGLTRVKHAQGDHSAISPLLSEAEQLAQQYEYNDHLASLRLTQGHLALENSDPSEALAFYQKAMIYALRYNRFLLDELIGGRPQGTPLHPIIPSLLECGKEGHSMLIALSDWWKTGVNDLGTPRPDTISPIPEGISLLDAEKIAREREPGDGLMQRKVVEQINAIL